MHYLRAGSLLLQIKHVLEGISHVTLFSIGEEESWQPDDAVQLDRMHKVEQCPHFLSFPFLSKSHTLRNITKLLLKRWKKIHFPESNRWKSTQGVINLPINHLVTIIQPTAISFSLKFSLGRFFCESFFFSCSFLLHLFSLRYPCSPCIFPLCFFFLPHVLFFFCRSSGVKDNRFWYAALAFVTLMLFTAAVGAVVFLGIFYTHSEACLLNKIFLGINSSLCFIVSMLAISPCIQKRKSLHKHIQLICLCLRGGNPFTVMFPQCSPRQACCSQESSVCMSCTSRSQHSPANQKKVSIIKKKKT